jgi:hypothetical protein
MIIKSVCVQNFRCVNDETLSCEKLTALVGRNGAGKSSFLRAIDMFYNANARYTEEDFYAQDTLQDIAITLTFSHLTKDETTLFQKYIESNELTVQKVMGWPAGRGNQKYYGTSLQNPEFAAFRIATGPNMRSEYNKLRGQEKYTTLPQYTNRDEAEEALSTWETANPALCMRKRDDGQFFGFKEVGEAHLERHTRFLFVPAVREASDDATEGRGSILTDIMDLVVRSVLSHREEIRLLEEETQKKYDELFDPSKIIELQNLGKEMTNTLKTYVPDASIELKWIIGEGIEVPMPTADVKLVEDEYASSVSRTGHGLQRAFILTMLQHLARAQMSAIEGENESEDGITPLTVRMPNLILGIEEPELYQHPNRQRHLSKILLQLALGSIKGVAEQTQVIYSTHSPLFVDIDRFNNIRVLRKEPGEQGKPRRTKVFSTTLDEVAKVIEKAEDKPDGTYRGDTLPPRLLTLMTPWMNESFFADVAVFVEGEEDRAAIIGTAYATKQDLESMGITIIPCNGKGNLHKPIAILNKLHIPAYAIWDSDEGKKGSKPESNYRLLRLFGESVEDWPERITDRFACFRCNMTTTLCEEIGQPLYDELLESCCERLCFPEKEHAVKNPIVIKEILEEARRQGKSSKSLDMIISQIVAVPRW